MDVQVTDSPERSRWEARRGDALAGTLAYEARDGAVALLHTVVRPEYEGQGVGGRLVEKALADARARGLQVLPSCSYVRAWLDRHPDQADLVPDGWSAGDR